MSFIIILVYFAAIAGLAAAYAAFWAVSVAIRDRFEAVALALGLPMIPAILVTVDSLDLAIGHLAPISGDFRVRIAVITSSMVAGFTIGMFHASKAYPEPPRNEEDWS